MRKSKINLICLLIAASIATSCSFVKISKSVNNMKFTYNSETSGFRFDNNLILIKTKIEDQPPVEMFLDLGASKSVIFTDSGFWKSYVEPEIIPLPVKMTGAGGGKVNLSAFNFGDISTDFFNVSNGFFIFQENEGMPGCERLRGIWGAEMFVPSSSKEENKVLIINMQDTTLTVSDTLPNLQNWTLVETRYKGLSKVFYVKINIGENAYFFLFDTGFNGGVYMNGKDIKSANEHSTLIAEERRFYGNIGRVLTGNIYDTVVDYKTNFRIANNLNADSVSVRMSKSINQNLIGMEFIKRFNVIIDYKNKNIYLQTNRNYSPDISSFFKVKGLSASTNLKHELIIQAMVVGSIAEVAGLKIGDEIISVNGLRVDSANICEIDNLYKNIDSAPTNNEIILKRGSEILKFIL